MDQNTFLSNADPAALDAIYNQYKQDPTSVDVQWARFFEGFDLARSASRCCPTAAAATAKWCAGSSRCCT